MAAVKIKVGSRPSGLDAAGWKKILLSNSLVTVRQNLRKALVHFIKHICVNKAEINPH